MELWDLYDENRALTGKTLVRGQKIPEDSYHIVVNAWIRNSRGQYLISQRSADRPDFPLLWECVGGSALAGEDSLTAILREIKEEVGLDFSPEDGKLAYSVIRKVINGLRDGDFLDVWLFEYDGPVDLSKATTAEVAQTKWMTVDEIRTLFDEKKFVYTLEYFFDEIVGK